MNKEKLIWIDTSFGHELNGKRVAFKFPTASHEFAARKGSFRVQTRDDDDKKSICIVVRDGDFNQILPITQTVVAFIKPTPDSEDGDYGVFCDS